MAIAFFLLAPYIAYDAIPTLMAGDHETSWLGIGLLIASLNPMRRIWWVLVSFSVPTPLRSR